MENLENPHIKRIWKSLSSFIENINCLYDSFDYSDNTLRSQTVEAQKAYNRFVKPYQVKGDDGIVKFAIPKDKERTHQHLERKLQRSQESSKLLKRSYIVSMVSQFDAFIANLLRNIYTINPDMLKQANQTLTFAELQNFGSLDEAREHIIESKIENILRDSHQEQFKELASAIGVETLKKFANWPKFVEITQRRNLFVHSNGNVSNQYLSICKKEGVDVGTLKKGEQLDVDSPYFVMAFNVFCEVAVKLSQTAMRVLLYKKDNTCLGEIDKCIISNIFDLIVEERYDVAVELSEFALQPTFKHSDKDRIYLLLNRAQAYKWKGDEAKCKSLLDGEDTSAWSGELKCPKYALEGNIDKVCALMTATGQNGEILKAEQYRSWPIFKGVRGEEKFKQAFKGVFGEELDLEMANIEEDKKPKPAIRVAKTHKEKVSSSDKKEKQKDLYE